MKNAIVTGATGFLGRNLTKLLIQRRYEVYAVVRPSSRNESYLPQSEHIHVVRSELATLENNLRMFPEKCDVFFHFAWGGVNREEIDNEQIHNRNIAQSLCCVSAAIKLGCDCFVDAGSRIEYGRCEGFFREDLQCHPLVAYGRAKIEFFRRAHQLCLGSTMKLLHARIYSVYGVDDHPWSLIYTSVNKMLRNEPISLSECKHRWNFMAVEDTADLLLTLYEQRDKIPAGDNCIFNVATDDIRPLRDFVEKIKELTHSESELQFGTFHQGAESAMSILPDMSKVKRIFGWEPHISFEEGISRMITALEGSE